MTFEDAICWMKLLKESKVNWINVAEDELGLVKRCEEAKDQAIDMALEALNNSIQMSNIQELQAENGFLKEMVKFYREQQTVEVVRCKDCRHGWYDDDIEYYTCRHPKGLNEELYGVDFCSYGERKE